LIETRLSAGRQNRLNNQLIVIRRFPLEALVLLPNRIENSPGLNFAGPMVD